MLLINIFLVLFTSFGSSWSGPRDLRRVTPDLSDPHQRDVAALGDLNDIYVHYHVDGSLLDRPQVGGEQGIVEYIMSLTDVINRDSFNPVNFNLVVSGFSFEFTEDDRDVMNTAVRNKRLHEGEEHIWVFVTDWFASSLAHRWQLYDGDEMSYARINGFGGYGFQHSDRTNIPHEIGHLFGLEHTHNIQMDPHYRRDVDVSPDYCGSGPNGRDCSTQPAWGGTLMSYCHFCGPARPLTSFHPYFAEQIQEHFRLEGGFDRIGVISFPKLRTFIPSRASSNRCASQGGNCNCNGVVYYGPTFSASSVKIFAVAQSSGNVRCSGGPGLEFPDPFEGRSKSCYCHSGATLTDVSYLPTEVDFTSAGRTPCNFECPRAGGCNVEIMRELPEWKCKEECVGDKHCRGYNWNSGSGDCRLWSNTVFDPSADRSGDFSGTTCWRRPEGDAFWPQARHVEIGAGSTTTRPTTIRPTTPVFTTVAPTTITPTTPDGNQCRVVATFPQTKCNGGRRIGRFDSPAECADAIPSSPSGFLTFKGRTCKFVEDCPVSRRSASRRSTLYQFECETEPRTTIRPTTTSLTTIRPTTPDGDCNADWVRIPREDCHLPIGGLDNLPDCSRFMDIGDYCEADGQLPNGGFHEINNCGSYDVFRYECTDGRTTQPPRTTTRILTTERRTTRATTPAPSRGGFQNMGAGYCRSSSGSMVDGKSHSFKTIEQCRLECESRSECIGYAGFSSGEPNMCYVHGSFDRDDQTNGWRVRNNNVLDIARTSGQSGRSCFKRV